MIEERRFSERKGRREESMVPGKEMAVRREGGARLASAVVMEKGVREERASADTS